MVDGEKIVFDEAFEEVGSHTDDLFVVVVTKRKTVECENQFSQTEQSFRARFFDRTLIKD